MDTWTLTFVAFGLLSQVGLLLYFAARRWRPDLERRWGWVIYALGLPAAGVALLGSVTGARPEHVLAFGLFAAWTAFGALVDLRLRIEWRNPVRPGIFAAYVGLFTLAQFAFWVPLWWIGRELWLFFAAVYAVQTTVNVLGHRAR